MEKQSKIREILSANGIDYKIRIIDRNSPSPFNSNRGRIGTFGQNLQLSCEYIIYVNKNDYELAKHYID